MHDAARPASTPHSVDNTDWLKTAAIILVLVGHFGHFFVADDRWWSAFARPAAPPFFFLLGYAQSRTVPLSWIWFGVILTLLESWNADWRWVAPNILLSLALIRLARPYVQVLLQRHGWVAFTLLVIALGALAPFAGKWALPGGFVRVDETLDDELVARDMLEDEENALELFGESEGPLPDLDKLLS